MNPRGGEALARAGLLAGGLLAGALVAEAALRLGGYAPARFQSPGELYSPRARVFLDCYPTNPRGYFDVDLARPEVRARYEAMGVREVARVAARAPWAVEFRYNALYFRDREIAPKRPGVVRVAVLGDSFTEGQGVKEEDTFPRRLEARLREGGGSWEVMNCARRGADFPGLHKMFVFVSNRGHGLVERRVEGLADALERLHALGFEQARQPTPHAVEARGHRVRRLVDVNEGAIEAVGQVDECFQQLPLGLPGGHVAIALDPPPVVLEVCPRPQVAVVLLLQLASQLLDRVLTRARRRRRVVSRVFLHVTRPPHFRVNSASTTSCAASAWKGPGVGG